MWQSKFLPTPTLVRAPGDIAHAHVTQPTCLGHAEAPGGGGGGSYQHHVCIGAPWLEFGAAACGAYYVSGVNYILLPRRHAPGDTAHAHVTQPTCLGHADAPGAGGGGLHQHHMCIGVPRTCLCMLRGRDEYQPPRRAAPCRPLRRYNTGLRLHSMSALSPIAASPMAPASNSRAQVPERPRAS